MSMSFDHFLMDHFVHFDHFARITDHFDKKNCCSALQLCVAIDRHVCVSVCRSTDHAKCYINSLTTRNSLWRHVTCPPCCRLVFGNRVSHNATKSEVIGSWINDPHSPDTAHLTAGSMTMQTETSKQAPLDAWPSCNIVAATCNGPALLLQLTTKSDKIHCRQATVVITGCRKFDHIRSVVWDFDWWLLVEIAIRTTAALKQRDNVGWQIRAPAHAEKDH